MYLWRPGFELDGINSGSCLQCFDTVRWAAGRACSRGYVSGSRYRFAYGLADATATHYLLLHQDFMICKDEATKLRASDEISELVLRFGIEPVLVRESLSQD